jgi:hypothetical protein
MRTQASMCGMIAALAMTLALGACTGSPFGSSSAGGGEPPKANAQSLLGMSDATPVDSTLGTRELTPEEKKVITDAVSLSIKDPASARFHWTKMPNTLEGSANYCASVDAKSAYPAYSGKQNFVVEAQLTGGKITSAVVGLIAGGKDAAIVTKMCAKYGLNPEG